MALITRFIDRFFKFYFALMLIGFVIAVLLMNIPRLLAGEMIPQTLERRTAAGVGKLP